MILIVDFILFSCLFLLWRSLEKRWKTIYISQNPTMGRYWNYLIVEEGTDATPQLQAALDFLGNRSGGTTWLDGGTYDIHEQLRINHPKRTVCVQGTKLVVTHKE